MFWKFNLMTSSHVDTLLEKEDVTLQELMDEDDILQECKAQNRKLIDFLVREDNMEEMVNLITQEPAIDADEKCRYKYPNTACELLTSDVSQINDKLADDPALVDKLYAFLESEKPLNPLLASFFSKVMGLLITRKSQMIFDYLKSKDDFIRTLMYHLGTSAIMDLLLRLITCIDSPEVRTAVINWLNEEKIVDKLVDRIIPSEDEEIHCNAAQSLCDIIKLSRDLMSQLQERADADPLLTAIESEETVTKLLSNMLDGEKNESCIVSGLSVVQTLLEFRKQGTIGLLENGIDQITQLDAERLAQGVTNVLQAIRPRLNDFHNILLEPPKQKYSCMPTTVGMMTPPLGNTRLQIARLLTTLVSTNTNSINQEFSNLKTIGVLLDLYFKYTWNNFLHTQVEQCINTILSSPPPQVEDKPEYPLLSQLFTECRLLQRIIDGWEQNDLVQSKNGGHRQGYMGHLTRIANDVVGSLEKGENVAIVKESYDAVSEESRKQWETFVAGPLAEMNKKNTVELVPNHTIPSSSEDDDGDFRDIPFPQDTAMQQAFSDYQLQQMTSNFIDQFGFNEEEFTEQEENSPFTERISTIDFNIQANDDDEPGSRMFEQRCNENIQPFDDNDSDEDIWEEKPFTVAPGSGISSSPIKRENNADSDDSTDSEDELSSPKIIPQQPSEKMEIDANEGWAKFDSAVEAAPPVAMDMGNPWESNSSSSSGTTTTTTSTTSSQSEGWADFSKFSSSAPEGPRSSSPVAMDTTENNSRSSAYLAVSAPADLASEVKKVSEGDQSSQPVQIDQSRQEDKATSADPIALEASLSGTGSGDSSALKLAEAAPEKPTSEPEAQVTSTDDKGFLAGSGLLKSKATAEDNTGTAENSAEPTENSIPGENFQTPAKSSMEQLRDQAKDAMDQFDKATTVTSSTTIQLQNGPV